MITKAYISADHRPLSLLCSWRSWTVNKAEKQHPTPTAHAVNTALVLRPVSCDSQTTGTTRPLNYLVKRLECNNYHDNQTLSGRASCLTGQWS